MQKKGNGTLQDSGSWASKVCRVIAFRAVSGGFRAIMLHTFGV